MASAPIYRKRSSSSLFRNIFPSLVHKKYVVLFLDGKNIEDIVLMATSLLCRYTSLTWYPNSKVPDWLTSAAISKTNKKYSRTSGDNLLRILLRLILSACVLQAPPQCRRRCMQRLSAGTRCFTWFRSGFILLWNNDDYLKLVNIHFLSRSFDHSVSSRYGKRKEKKRKL